MSIWEIIGIIIIIIFCLPGFILTVLKVIEFYKKF
jgi:hypothetical protein